ncbi:hypothetical protein N2152v2_006780 [Parachlorella kessleri]
MGRQGSADVFDQQPQLLLSEADTIRRVVPINDSAGVFEALQTTEDVVLLLQGPLSLGDAEWDTPLTIAGNQTVVLRGGVTGPVDLSQPDGLLQAGATTVDWGRREGLFQVEPGGVLVLDGVVSQNVASYPAWLSRQSNTSRVSEVSGISLLPSVLFSVGSTQVFRNTLSSWLSADCSPRRMNDLVVTNYQNGLLRGAGVGQPNGTEFSVKGPVGLNVTVLESDQGNTEVGHLWLVLNNAVANCVVDPSAGAPPSPSGSDGSSSGGGNDVPAWVWVLVALGACALLAAAAAGFLLMRRRRRRREREAGDGLAKVEVVAPGGPALGLGGQEQQGPDSGPEEGGSPKSEKLGVSKRPSMDVVEGRGVLRQLTSAWRARSGEVAGLELEELLGRGGFASVFKGRWHGALVAVKVVEHIGSSCIADRVEREAALAVSVSHPNVVSTYQVSTLQAAELRRMQQHFSGLRMGTSLGLGPLAAALPASQQAQQDQQPQQQKEEGCDVGPPPLQGWESWGSVPPVPAATDYLATISSGEGTLGPLAQSTLGDASTSADSGGSQRPAMVRTPRAAAATGTAGAAAAASPSASAPAPGGLEVPPLGIKPDGEAAAAGRSLGYAPAGQQQQPAPREAAGGAALDAARQVSLESALEEELAGGLDPGFLPAEQENVAEGSNSPAATIILMEYCDRGSLEVALRQGRLLWRRDGSPDQEAILRMLSDVATGLDYLHSVGIVHGDIKAGNLLIKSAGYTRRGYACKLADFGVSRMLEESQTSVQASVLGTAAYLAPELMRGSKMSTASDIYSFGILMWEAWQGRHAFEDLPLPMLSYQVAHLQLRPPVPPACPPAYAELMQRCWDGDAQARPCAGEVLAALRRMLGTLLLPAEGGSFGSPRGGAGASEGGSPRGVTASSAC